MQVNRQPSSDAPARPVLAVASTSCSDAPVPSAPQSDASRSSASRPSASRPKASRRNASRRNDSRTNASRSGASGDNPSTSDPSRTSVSRSGRPRHATGSPDGQAALVALDRALSARRMLIEALLRLLVAPGLLAAGLTPLETKELLEKHMVSTLKAEGFAPPAIADLLACSARWVYRVREKLERRQTSREPQAPSIRELVLSILASVYPRALTSADVHRRVSRELGTVEVETVRNLLSALCLEGWLTETRTPTVSRQTHTTYRMRSGCLELDDVSGVERRNNLWESLPTLETVLTGYAQGVPDVGFGRFDLELRIEDLPEFHRRVWAAVRGAGRELERAGRQRVLEGEGRSAHISGILGFYPTIA